MAPIAAGFMILVAAAAVMGVLVGAIGGAVAWRLRSHVAVGGVLTAVAYLLLVIAEHPGDFIFLGTKLSWGVPAMSVTFLLSSVAAAWLERGTRLRPILIALAACALSIILGFPYLLLFRISMRAPLLAALLIDSCLVLLLLLRRRRPVTR